MLKTAIKLFVAIPNSRLSTNFQLNIFIFVARVSLQTLLQSLKQKDRKSAPVGNVPNSLPLQVIKYYMTSTTCWHIGKPLFFHLLPYNILVPEYSSFFVSSQHLFWIMWKFLKSQVKVKVRPHQMWQIVDVQKKWSEEK